MVPRRENGRVVRSNGFTSQEVAMLDWILFPHGRAKLTALSETVIRVYLLTFAVKANDAE